MFDDLIEFIGVLFWLVLGVFLLGLTMIMQAMPIILAGLVLYWIIA